MNANKTTRLEVVVGKTLCELRKELKEIEWNRVRVHVATEASTAPVEKVFRREEGTSRLWDGITVGISQVRPSAYRDAMSDMGAGDFEEIRSLQKRLLIGRDFTPAEGLEYLQSRAWAVCPAIYRDGEGNYFVRHGGVRS